ncbi:MBL fold metallo-hydrolase [Chloroflexota bacterium]
MTELMPGVHRLKLPLPINDPIVQDVNVYLFRGDNGYLMVDAGWNTEEAYASLNKQLTECGIDIKDISRIVVTHVHPDHYGLVGRIKEISHARFLLHRLEKDLIESRYVSMDALLQRTGKWLYSSGISAKYLPELQHASVGMVKFVVPIYPDVILHGNETISTGKHNFRVYWSPGHSSGHICLYEPAKKLLLSGDHILPIITPNVGFHPQSSKNPLKEYVSSLKELRELDINLVLPGHEDPFTGIKSRIDGIIRHHRRRRLAILAVLASEQITAYHIAREILWQSKTDWQNLPAFHKRLALAEVLGHLELMRMEGRIIKYSKNGIMYYRKS